MQIFLHVLDVSLAYQASTRHEINELSLGLWPDALYGVYAKYVHVRMTCLNVVKCIPAVVNRYLPENVEVATSIWIALHDLEKLLKWQKIYGIIMGCTVELFKALSHIRVAPLEVLAVALDEYPVKVLLCLHKGSAPHHLG
ncbi:hypothetical protein RJT34_21743 [Clitoria ternatea]|uniref:Uncharacterized protein n=1 Tax=Clitoria ternatea TaxID=43366 RepID=A0AAN9IUJ9_CLITE